MKLMAKFDAFQQRRPRLSFLVGVLDKYRKDSGARLAAVVAYFGFFSIFPALLALTSVSGYLLADQPTWRENIVDSAVGGFPVVGDSIAEASLDGSGFALAVGLLGALWAGVGAMTAAQYALNEVWDVPHNKRPNAAKARAAGLAMLVVFASGLIAAGTLSNVVARLGLHAVTDLGLSVATIAINVGVALVAYRLLTAVPQTWSTVWPGAIIAGFGSFLLQGLGTILVDRYVDNASDTYGTFAVVIGLLTWFHLLAQVYLIGAEVNAVRARRLWPVSLAKAS